MPSTMRSEVVRRIAWSMSSVERATDQFGYAVPTPL